MRLGEDNVLSDSPGMWGSTQSSSCHRVHSGMDCWHFPPSPCFFLSWSSHSGYLLHWNWSFHAEMIMTIWHLFLSILKSLLTLYLPLLYLSDLQLSMSMPDKHLNQSKIQIMLALTIVVISGLQSTAVASACAAGSEEVNYWDMMIMLSLSSDLFIS